MSVAGVLCQFCRGDLDGGGHKKHCPLFQGAFNFDLERMKLAVASPIKVMPRGLSREEKLRFLAGDD